jgi:SP family general alpha glucoside:H+ symporter-like MFS transporter
MSSSPKDNFAQVEHIDPDSKMGFDEVEKPAAREANAFSLLFSTAIIMEGYDLSLLGSFYGYDA